MYRVLGSHIHELLSTLGAKGADGTEGGRRVGACPSRWERSKRAEQERRSTQ